MSNGSPNLLREVERMVLLLENREWTDTNPRHPLAERLEAALHDLHDEACKDEFAGAAAVRDAALDDALRVLQGWEHPENPQANDIAGAIRALKGTPAAAVECEVPPLGWLCTRAAGHDGPCAAIEAPEDVAFVEGGMDRLRKAGYFDDKAPAAAVAETERCTYCDGTGDVHGFDGEWRGVCTECDAGKQLSGNPGQVADAQVVSNIRVGNLPTMNQDEYPGLGDWWVQLRIGADSDEVLARVYGNSPQQAVQRALRLAPQPSAQAQPSVNAGEVADHEWIEVPEIGNYYGCLRVKREQGVDYWSIENYDGDHWYECDPAVANAIRAAIAASKGANP